MKLKAMHKINFKDYGVIIGFLILCTIISFATPNFLTKTNILNLLRQSSIIGIIATGPRLQYRFRSRKCRFQIPKALYSAMGRERSQISSKRCCNCRTRPRPSKQAIPSARSPSVRV